MGEGPSKKENPHVPTHPIPVRPGGGRAPRLSTGPRRPLHRLCVQEHVFSFSRQRRVVPGPPDDRVDPAGSATPPTTTPPTTTPPTTTPPTTTPPTTTPPTTTPPKTVGNSIVTFEFNPNTIVINVGDRVRWTNNDLVSHTATSSGNWDSGTLALGDSFLSPVFDSSGTFNYICSIHPWMTATVVVNS